MALEILYSDVIKTFKLEDGRLFRLLKGGCWREVEIKVNHCGGYCQVGWNGKSFLAHRLMYSIYHKVDVDINLVIDHKDGEGINNSYDNLILGTSRDNSGNRVEHRNGKLLGCYYDDQKKKWRVKIKINNKTIHLGRYPTEEEASTVYCKARELIDKFIDRRQFRELLLK